MKNKLYYSPFTEGFKRKRIYPLSSLAQGVLKCILKRRITVVNSEVLPAQEPCIVCTNHAKEYGPLAMLSTLKFKPRLWCNANMMSVKAIPKHCMKDIFPNKRGLSYAFFYCLSCLLAVPLAANVLVLEPIPVYHDLNMKYTIKKSAASLAEGKSLLLFPESNEQNLDYEYVNNIKRGFAFVARDYINACGKPISVVPAYVCKSLKTIVYGNPIRFEGFVDFKAESGAVAKYLMDEIERLAKTLPKHEIVYYDNSPRV